MLPLYICPEIRSVIRYPRIHRLLIPGLVPLQFERHHLGRPPFVVRFRVYRMLRSPAAIIAALQGVMLEVWVIDFRPQARRRIIELIAETKEDEKTMPAVELHRPILPPACYRLDFTSSEGTSYPKMPHT